MSDTKPGKIHAAIIAIMRSVGHIAKNQRNTQQNFMYRGIDDVFNACHPRFAEHGVYSTSKVLDAKHASNVSQKGTTMNHAILHIQFTYWAEDGSNVTTEVVGEGLDFGSDKASNKAMSIAAKYALLQLLQIPTAMVDPDASPPPERVNAAPTVQPRSNRASQGAVSAITERWKERFGTSDRDDSRARFVRWVNEITGHDFNPLVWSAWASEDIALCTKALNTPKPTAS